MDLRDFIEYAVASTLISLERIFEVFGFGRSLYLSFIFSSFQEKGSPSSMGVTLSLKLITPSPYTLNSYFSPFHTFSTILSSFASLIGLLGETKT